MNLALYWDLTAKMSGLTTPNPVLQTDETGLQFIPIGKDVDGQFVNNFQPLLEDSEYPIAVVPSESLFRKFTGKKMVPTRCHRMTRHVLTHRIIASPLLRSG
jgi:hypothetical protein